MEYEDLLVYIDRMTEERHACALQIIKWLIDEETPMDTMTQIFKGFTWLLNEKREYSPGWIMSFFGGEFQELIDKKVIEHVSVSFPPNGTVKIIPMTDEVFLNPKTGELEDYPVTLCHVGDYDGKQKREIAARCEKGIDAILQAGGAQQVPPKGDKWFVDLSVVEQRKLRITYLLEQTEIALRKLLAAKYETIDGWTKRTDYVPKPIRLDKYGEKISGEEACDECGKPKKKEETKIGKIKKNAGRNKGWRGRKLGDVETFLNACTLSELIDIIRYRQSNVLVPQGEPKEFDDVFVDLWKSRRDGGKFDSLFVAVKQIRDSRAHFDQSLPWDTGIEKWMETIHLDITQAVTDYLEKQKHA